MNIKFVFSDKSEISLPYEKAKQVLQSDVQIVMVSDDNGEWSGVTINKSYLMKTVKDHESEIGRPLPEERQIEPKSVDQTKLISEMDKAKGVLIKKLSA